MKKVFYTSIVMAVSLLFLASCGGGSQSETSDQEESVQIADKVQAFAEVKLTTSIDHLSDNERAMLPYLFRAAEIMDDLFWLEAFGNKDSLLAALPDAAHRDFAKINYGPWERLNNNTPFVEGYGDKPKGARFYPADMTEAEFEAFSDTAKMSLYTMIERDENGQLRCVPYHVKFEQQIKEASDLLRKAAELAEDEGFRNYLNHRADALLTDQYLQSDLAWMDMKNNKIDFIVGPIESYEDRLFGYKAAHESFILIKDLDWSQRLAHYMKLLPQLQKALPVDDKYKQESPGSDSDLGVYDVIYYAGDCNAGSKTIAINLPNDAQVHVTKGSRKLQLKNAMRYKFDKIMEPIADLLIVPEQREHVTFDAFFENTMFHEVSHGLGVKETINGRGEAREALKEAYSAIEEGKADILGIFMIEQLVKMGELKDHDLMDNYVTFMAGIFRSIRFGAASAHGKANTVRFHYFQQMGAFSRCDSTGLYRIHPEKMEEAVAALGRDILVLQGDGNYEGARDMLNNLGRIDAVLQGDLDRINEANIPVDLRYIQGPEQVGLEPLQQ